MLQYYCRRINILWNITADGNLCYLVCMSIACNMTCRLINEVNGRVTHYVRCMLSLAVLLLLYYLY